MTPPPPQRRDVLMVANDFPPVGGAGVQRSLYFAKYLPEHGWRPVVLTVRGVAYPTKDPTLLDELPPCVEIVRTESLELRRLLWRLRRFRARSPTAGPTDGAGAGTSSRRLRELGRGLRRWLFVPDDRLLWAPFALRAALRHAHSRPVHAVYATLPAYSSGPLGQIVARRLGVPLVLDLRDPWTLDPYFPAPTALHAWLNRRFEASCLQAAARIVVISPEMRRRLLVAYPDLSPDRVRVITNGFDGETQARVAPVRRPDRFVVAYVGSLYAHHLESLRAACAAWDRAAELDARFAASSELELIGRCDPEIVAELGRWPRVRSRRLGYLPHEQATAHLLGGAALLLLIKDLDPRRDLITIPGKLFEYVGAGPPILMIGPEGDAAEIVRASGGDVLREADRDGATEVLLRRFGEHHSGGGRTPPSPELHRRYERKALAGELAAVLDAVVEGG